MLPLNLNLPPGQLRPPLHPQHPSGSSSTTPPRRRRQSATSPHRSSAPGLSLESERSSDGSGYSGDLHSLLRFHGFYNVDEKYRFSFRTYLFCTAFFIPFLIFFFPYVFWKDIIWKIINNTEQNESENALELFIFIIKNCNLNNTFSEWLMNYF